MARATATWRRHAFAAVWAVWFLACGAVAAPGEDGNYRPRLCDQPTSYASHPDRLELASAWGRSGGEAQKFHVIVPPGRELQPEVLEIEVERVATALTSAPLTTTVTAQTVNANRAARERIFSSQPIGYFRHYRVVEVQVSPIFRAELETVRIRRLRWAYRWSPPYQLPGGFRDEIVRRRDMGFASVLPHLVVNPDALGVYTDPNPPPGEMPPGAEDLTFGRLAGGRPPLVRYGVRERGLYRLDLSRLAPTNGARPSPERLHLYGQGRPVPLYLHKDPRQPDAPPEMLFYGVAADSKYTRDNPYWLAEDAKEEGPRMATAPVSKSWRALAPETTFPEALPIEQDNELVIHADEFLTVSDFRWVWGELPPTDMPASDTARMGPPDKVWFRQTTFELPGLSDPEGETRFDLAFYYGLNKEDVEYSPMGLPQPVTLQFRVNGGTPRPVTLQRPNDFATTFTVHNRDLRPTSNTFEITLAPGQLWPDYSIYFDRLVAHYRRTFEVPEHGFTFASDPPTSAGWRHYALTGHLPARPLILDVADPAAPKIMEYEIDKKSLLHFGQRETRPALYRVLSLDDVTRPKEVEPAAAVDVSSQDTPVDYLIVAHREFIGLLRPLAAALEQADWRVRVVDIADIYASFAYGLEGPDALKRYLSWTLRAWPGGGPSYVLFVGDCSSDYRGDFLNEVRNFVPSYTLEHAEDKKKWASEHWFTTLCGADEFSDIFLGRLSVNSRADAQTVIDKIVRYRTQPLLDPWRMRVTYVADRGTFDDDAEELRRRWKSPDLVGQTIYLDDFPWEDNFYLAEEIVEQMVAARESGKVSPLTTTRILDTFNQGTVFLTYQGHGSPNLWSNERIWFGGDSPNSDILLLRNGPRLPLVVNMTCNSGAIDYPDPPWNLCISEDFMRSPTGGAIAMFVPTAPGYQNMHVGLSRELHHAMFRENIRALGDMALLAKYRYILANLPLQPLQLDLIRMFLLLGEPACVLQMPEFSKDLSVDRRAIASTTGGVVRVTGRGTLGPGQKGLLGVYSPRDVLHVEAPIAFAADGRFEQSFQLQPTDNAGTWTVRAYIWHDAAKRDTAAAATFGVVAPEIALDQFVLQPQGKTLAAGEPTTLVCTVVNRTALGAASPTLRIYRATGSGRALVREQALALGPNETKTIRLPWKAEPGFQRFEAELTGTRQDLGGTAPAQRIRTAEATVADRKPGVRLEVSPRGPELRINRMGTQYTRESALTIGSSGATTATSVTVELQYAPGDRETQPLGLFKPGEVRTVRFQKPVAKPDLPAQYSVALRWRDAGTSTVGQVERRGTIDRAAFPDLTVVREGVRFIDETNRLLFRNPTPTDGQTVFLDVPVRNLGRAAADRAFTVEAWDGDPARGGRRLLPLDSMARDEIPFLEPGATKTIRLRWDPRRNAGAHTIAIVVDGDHRVTEADETNNTTTHSLHVLTKSKLGTGLLYVEPPSAEDARRNRWPLRATVRNDGETTARAVLVEFYLGPKYDPARKIGEVLAERIPPKAETGVILKWENPTPAQMEEVNAYLRQGRPQERFSFLVRLRGSSQRVTNLPE